MDTRMNAIGVKFTSKRDCKKDCEGGRGQRRGAPQRSSVPAQRDSELSEIRQDVADLKEKYKRLEERCEVLEEKCEVLGEKCEVLGEKCEVLGEKCEVLEEKCEAALLPAKKRKVSADDDDEAWEKNQESQLQAAFAHMRPVLSAKKQKAEETTEPTEEQLAANERCLSNMVNSGMFGF